MDELTETVLKKLLLLADCLEYLGENRFKVLAYRRAVRSIQESGMRIAELYRSGALRELPNVGEAVFKKVGEIIETGELKKLNEALGEIPHDVAEMLQKLPISGEKVKCLTSSGIDSMEKLRAAVLKGSLDGVHNLGKSARDRIEKFFKSQ